MADHSFSCRSGLRILVAIFAIPAGYAGAETNPAVVADRQQVNEICSQQADALGLHEEARWIFRARCKSRAATAAACSEQADALGLHGEARWNYRARCKA